MITSKQNSLVKEIRSLADKKFRDRLNLFVIEGVKPVKEAIEKGQRLYAVVGTERALEALLPCNERVEVVSEEIFSYISEEVTPQGVLAVAFKPQNTIVKPTGRCLLLDGVSDPANVGAIIRTAAACGYNDVYTTSDCADAYSQKSVRASMTGVLRVNIRRGTREELLSVIDCPIIVADMNGEDLFTFKKMQKFCLVIGNEGNGVSQIVKDKADFVVSIKMENGVESLNAAVSAGILMYSIK